ncbi:MAG: protein-arginine deiminase [Mycobacterium sp.]|jgi:protein-arginine deiminase|nr:protein-arginine deiminase [Mycobacterium sp.]
MDVDGGALLALRMAPARAYRELVYRPGGELAGRIGERFEIIARPGRAPANSPRVGDVLLTVTLGRRGGGRCDVLTDANLTRSPIGDVRHRVPHGQLLLRPRDFGSDEFGEQVPPGSGRRQIVLDGTVIDQFWRGNAEYARTFQELARTADLYIAQRAYDEAVTNRIPQMATATRLVLDHFSIRIAPNNDPAAGQDVLKRNAAQSRPPMRKIGDAYVGAQTRAFAPEAEVWSSDASFRNNYKGVEAVGVRVAPESYKAPHISGPNAPKSDYRGGFRLLGMPDVEIDQNGKVVTPGGGGTGGSTTSGGGGGGGASGGKPPPTFTAGQRITAAAVLAAMAANAVGNKIISHLNERDIKAALARVESQLQAQQASEPNMGILLQFRFTGGVVSGEGPTAEARFQGLSWQRARSESEAKAKFSSMDPSSTYVFTWIPPLAPETGWSSGGLAKFADVAKMEFLRLGFAQIGGFSVKRRSFSANLSEKAQRWATGVRFHVLRPPNTVAYRGVRGGRESASLTLVDRDVVDGTVRAIIIDGTPVVPILAADQTTAEFFRATSAIKLDHSGVVLEPNIDEIRWVRPEQIEMIDGPFARFVQWTKENPDWQKDLPFPKPAPAGDPNPFVWDRYKGRWVQKKGSSEALGDDFETVAPDDVSDSEIESFDGFFADLEPEWFGEAKTCVPEAEPGVPGSPSPHPVIRKGSNRPSVGYAQQCLNEFLTRFSAGSVVCPTNTAEASDFINRKLDAMRADKQLPLVVDCIHGTNTERAVCAVQACFGLGRDGVVGQQTWPVLKTFTFRLLLDAGRDGTLKPAAPGWQFGATGQGAVVLVNNDDDAGSGQPDNENQVIGAGNDTSELAPLVIESIGPQPTGTTVELEVSDPVSLRVFGGNSAGSAEIVGPKTGARHQFANASAPRIELSMEGVRYARRGFTGEATLTLRTTQPGAPTNVQTATVRVAPWIIPNHLDAAERVFVVDFGKENRRFRTELRALVQAAGCQLAETVQPSDPWIQDCMEFGYSTAPGGSLRTVFRAPRPRPLQTFPRSLLGVDLGFVEEGVMDDSTFNSTGNLEASPPVTVSGKQFPVGRIYFGPGRSGEPFEPDVREFLRAQLVQEPIELDTGWLTVGHVDEVTSFVPAPGGKGFRLLLASPRRAYAILDGLATTSGTAKMLVGRLLRAEYPTRGRVNVERTVSKFLALKDDFNPELKALVKDGLVSHTPTTLRRFNDARQADIDAIKTRLTTGLELADSDIIEIPAVFMPNPIAPTLADALVPGMVNMLVINSHCVVPKPFGPIVGGVDQFEKDVRDQLSPLNLTVDFLDCWEEYHVFLGEVHCGTNTLRKANAVKWWEFTP